MPLAAAGWPQPLARGGGGGARASLGAPNRRFRGGRGRFGGRGGWRGLGAGAELAPGLGEALEGFTLVDGGHQLITGMSAR
jgi:hypothetical protein